MTDTAELKGAKADANKPRPTLILASMASAMQAIIALGEHGAAKYSDDNWLRVANARQRYTDALLRHTLAELAGEDTDPDSGTLHAVHTAWNAIARLELILRARVAAKADKKRDAAVTNGHATFSESDHADAIAYLSLRAEEARREREVGPTQPRAVAELPPHITSDMTRHQTEARVHTAVLTTQRHEMLRDIAAIKRACDEGDTKYASTLCSFILNSGGQS